jgi:hypothetical protein
VPLKPKNANQTAERIAELLRILSLTRQEQLIVAALLISMLLGAVVMHLRREYGWHHPIPAAAATPHASPTGS